MKEKVVIGMSGGVDSAVAAALLVEQGYDVTALFMRNWEEKDESGNCTSLRDYEDMMRTCDHLGIQGYAVNFVKEYWDNVFKYFLDEHAAGRTPNPDILCNSEIKFKRFLDTALSLGADYMATGHYAGVRHDGVNHFELLKAVDNNKDQSYFLCKLNQYQLSKTLFPLHRIPKPEIRAIAAALKLPVAQKKDSTGICFIGERNYKEFLSNYFAAQPGDIRTVDGQIVGLHTGLMFYTLGQRKGMGIGGSGSGEPWFVVHKDARTNSLIVAQGEHHPSLYASILETETAHWIKGIPPVFPLKCTAKSRYRQKDQDVTVISLNNGRLLATFDIPQRSLTPGQSFVMYQEEVCIGSAVIERVRNVFDTSTD
jgi:tRNA-uridine 2-sulfurtransferase